MLFIKQVHSTQVGFTLITFLFAFSLLFSFLFFFFLFFTRITKISHPCTHLSWNQWTGNLDDIFSAWRYWPSSWIDRQTWMCQAKHLSRKRSLIIHQTPNCTHLRSKHTSQEDWHFMPRAPTRSLNLHNRSEARNCWTHISLDSNVFQFFVCTARWRAGKKTNKIAIKSVQKISHNWKQV